MPLKNEYKDFHIKDLSVSPENPRHDELENEVESINWLTNNLTERMKKLSQDIVDTGFVYDPPLLSKEKGEWKLHDGNRRIACLKLIHNPSIANDTNIQKFYEALSSSYKGRIPTTVHCRIEDDPKIINDILERRHAGGETGIGQMPWTPEGKDNFFIRKGLKNPSPKFGNAVSRYLKENDIVAKGDKVPVSIFDRLLSNEDYKNKIGVSFKGKKLSFIGNIEQSEAVLKRIVDDNKSGAINLNKAWSKTEKDKYLKILENDGILPKVITENKETNTVKTPLEKPLKTRKISKQTNNRTNLIPANIELSEDVFVSERILSIFNELQRNLTFKYHINAIAILFRVLIEMSVDSYLENTKIEVYKKKGAPTLADRFSACLDELVNRGFISNKDRKVLVKFREPERFLSADTFHAYVHNKLANPIESELIAKWDTLEIFILECLYCKPSN
jgi:hypothetical protein